MKFDENGLRILFEGKTPSAVVLGGDIVRYIAGVVHRERERIAQILIAADRKDLADKVIDDRRDMDVFAFKGPETRLGFDINDFLRQCVQFLAGMGLPNRLSAGRTNRGGHSNPDWAERSLLWRYSSDEPERYRNGRCVDYVFSKEDRSYFASIFFDTDKQLTEYRLVRLAKFIPGPMDDKTMTAVYDTLVAGDVVLDEGTIAWADGDPLQIFSRVQTWLRTMI